MTKDKSQHIDTDGSTVIDMKGSELHHDLKNQEGEKQKKEKEAKAKDAKDSNDEK